MLVAKLPKPNGSLSPLAFLRKIASACGTALVSRKVERAARMISPSTPTALPIEPKKSRFSVSEMAGAFGVINRRNAHRISARAVKIEPVSGRPVAALRPLASPDEIDDDRDSEDLRKGSNDRPARMRERERIETIMRHPSALGQEALAAHIATQTKTPRHQAVRLLQSLAAVAELQQSEEREKHPRGRPYLVTCAF